LLIKTVNLDSTKIVTHSYTWVFFLQAYLFHNVSLNHLVIIPVNDRTHAASRGGVRNNRFWVILRSDLWNVIIKELVNEMLKLGFCIWGILLFQMLLQRDYYLCIRLGLMLRLREDLGKTRCLRKWFSFTSKRLLRVFLHITIKGHDRRIFILMMIFIFLGLILTWHWVDHRRTSYLGVTAFIV
jgi:hypothetical protein